MESGEREQRKLDFTLLGDSSITESTEETPRRECLGVSFGLVMPTHLLSSPPPNLLKDETHQPTSDWTAEYRKKVVHHSPDWR